MRSWSKSSLEKLDTCGWRFKLRYIDGLDEPASWNMETGTAVHAAVEAHESERLRWWASRGAEGDREGLHLDALRMLAEEHTEAKRHDLPDEHDYEDGRPFTFETATEAAWRALEAWWHAPIPKGQPGEGGSLRDRAMAWRPVAFEPRFRVWVPDVAPRPLLGFIDGLYLDLETGEFVEVDYKIALKLDGWKKDGKGKRLQPTLYGAASPLAPNLPVRATPRFEYHVMRYAQGKNANFQAVRVIPINVDELDREWVDGKVRAAEERLAAGDFTPNPDSNLCSPRWCPHYAAPGSPCPARPEGYTEGSATM
ncbi:MAG: PD-(D/E)XK nuclease family protein [Nitriliruptorales bacterium]